MGLGGGSRDDRICFLVEENSLEPSTIGRIGIFFGFSSAGAGVH